jgi:hypothetical protein
MHEVLAPLVWAGERSLELTALVALPVDSPLHALTADEKFREHDAYSLFCGLMVFLAPYYETARGEEAPVLELAARVQGERLSAADRELHEHLSAFTRTPVLPQIYMLPWFRLLFGRQFDVDDLVVVWDAVFATCASNAGPSFDDWLETLALLSVVVDRQALLRSRDGAGALRLLLHARAPPPSFVVRCGAAVAADARALAPVVDALRRHASLASVFPEWFVRSLAAAGVIDAAPARPAPDAGQDDYATAALRLGSTALCLARDDARDDDDAAPRARARPPAPPPRAP